MRDNIESDKNQSDIEDTIPDFLDAHSTFMKMKLGSCMQYYSYLLNDWPGKYIYYEVYYKI